MKGRSKVKSVFAGIGVFFLSSLFTLFLLEVVLRFLPVNDGFDFQSVNEAQPVFRARPDQTVTSSVHWDFFNARRLKVNNVGFRNDQDYLVEGQRPLLAVVGDSYVEAIQADYADTFYGRLDASLRGRARVYSFGYSGAPLSQYLAWARYARETFGAGYLLFSIISNDFDESMGQWKRGPGFHHFEACDEMAYCLRRVDYQVGKFRPLVKASALARYLIYNLQILEVFPKVGQLLISISRRDKTPVYVGNIEAAVESSRLSDSKLAVDLFFRDLAPLTGLPPRRIAFIVDGRYYGDSATAFDQSFFGQMRHYFMEKATSIGYDVIDLKPVFSQHFETHKQRFESLRDGHWNELGHELIAGELIRYYETRLPN